MRSRILIAFILILPLLIAGCTSKTTTFKNGLVIEKFSPDLSSIPSDSPVDITLIVKNTGESKATGAKAILADLPQNWIDRSTNKKISEILPDASSVLIKDLGTELLGVDKVAGFQGDSGSATWPLEAPVLSNDQMYTITASILYGYSTSISSLVKAVDFNYFKSLTEEQQKTVDTGVTLIKATEGPLSITVKSQQALVSTDLTLPIEFEFKNEGSGILFGVSSTGDILKTESGKMKFEKGKINTILVDIPRDTNCEGKKIGADQNIYEVRMVQGKTGRLLCHVVLGAQGGIQTTKTFSLDLKASYVYLIEGKTSIKVSKTLYQPKIYDISLDTYAENIKHTHGGGAYADIVVKFTNVGNQNIKVDSWDWFVQSDIFDVSSATALKVKEFTKKELNEFDSDTTIYTASFPPLKKQYTLSTEINRLPDSSTGLKEENIENNKITKTITLDYDINVADLKAELDDFDSPIKITATVRNDGTNVIGNNIPVEIAVDDKKIDYRQCNINPKKDPTFTPDPNLKTTTDYVQIQTLPHTSQTIICYYTPPTKKTEYTIRSSVIPSLPLEEGRTTNNANAKPNGEAKFKIIYDVTIPESSSGFSVTKSDAATGKVTYTLNTRVANVGTVTAKDIRVIFTDAEGKIGSKDSTVCEKIISSLASKTSTPVSCEMKPITIRDPIKINVKLTTLLTQTGTQPDTGELTLLPPDDKPPVILKGESMVTTLKSSPIIYVTTDEPATCRYSKNVPDIKYDDMKTELPTRETITGTSGTKVYKSSIQLEGLATDAYNYYVRCSDAFGNKNAVDFPITFAVTPPTILTSSPSGIVLVSNPTISVTTDEPAICGYLSKSISLESSSLSGLTIIKYNGPTGDTTKLTSSIATDLDNILERSTRKLYTVDTKDVDTLTTLVKGEIYLINLKAGLGKIIMWTPTLGGGSEELGESTVYISTTGKELSYILSHSHELKNLADGDYTYNIRCSDAVGNENKENFPIKFTVNTKSFLTSLAGDTTPPYWDNLKDKKTEAVLSVASGMTCSFYGEDRNNPKDCLVTGLTAMCSIGDPTTGLSESPNYPLHITCMDAARNAKTVDVNFGVDYTSPLVGQAEIYIGTTKISGSTVWYTGPISIRTLPSSTYDSTSGIDKDNGCKYTLDNGASWSPATYDSVNRLCTADITADPRKDITINFKVTDIAGNSAVGTSKSYSRYASPTVSLSATSPPDGTPYTFDTWTKEDVKVTISCPEVSAEICAATTKQYCVDKVPDDATKQCDPTKTPTEFGTKIKLYGGPFKIYTVSGMGSSLVDIQTTEGITYLRYATFDVFGNEIGNTFKNVRIDKTAPDSSKTFMDTPGDGTQQLISSPPSFIQGQTADKTPVLAISENPLASGIGTDSVKFYIQRSSDNKYWTGSEWSSGLTWLSATNTATNGDETATWRSNVNLPSTMWTVGTTYSVQAQATDKVGNTITGLLKSFQIISG